MRPSPTSISRMCPRCGRPYGFHEHHACEDEATEIRSAVTDPLINVVLADRHRIDAVLQSGGMGIVYRGYHLRLKKPTAIKFLLQDATDEIAERFDQEAQAASQINHPNVVVTIDFGTIPDGRSYLVMELVEGTPLQEIIDKLGSLPIQQACAFAEQVALGLQAAHEKGIVHRDLKPGNIIVQQDRDPPVVKIIDFGIAKVAPRPGAPAQPGGPLTVEGTVLGTPEYMSPEQGLGERVDGRSDQYALGCILYEMLTGRLPFTANQPYQIMMKHITEAAIPPRQLRPEIPTAVESLVQRMMEKKPANRLPDMQACVRALRGLKDLPTGSPPEPLPLPPPPPPPTTKAMAIGLRRFWPVALVAGGLGLALIIWLVMRWSRLPEQPGGPITPADLRPPTNQASDPSPLEPRIQPGPVRVQLLVAGDEVKEYTIACPHQRAQRCVINESCTYEVAASLSDLEVCALKPLTRTHRPESATVGELRRAAKDKQVFAKRIKSIRLPLEGIRVRLSITGEGLKGYLIECPHQQAQSCTSGDPCDYTIVKALADAETCAIKPATKSHKTATVKVADLRKAGRDKRVITERLKPL